MQNSTKDENNFDWFICFVVEHFTRSMQCIKYFLFLRIKVDYIVWTNKRFQTIEYE